MLLQKWAEEQEKRDRQFEASQQRLAAEREERDKRFVTFLEESQQRSQQMMNDTLNQFKQTMSSMLSSTTHSSIFRHSSELDRKAQGSDESPRRARVEIDESTHTTASSQLDQNSPLLNVTIEDPLLQHVEESDVDKTELQMGVIPESPHTISASDLNINNTPALTLSPIPGNVQATLSNPTHSSSPLEQEIDIDRAHLRAGILRAEEFYIRQPPSPKHSSTPLEREVDIDREHLREGIRRAE